jgi:ribose transport system permease protein
LLGELGPLLVLVLIVLLFTAFDYHLHGRNGSFASMRNLRVVLVQATTVAVAALGLTPVIIAGGIDLSAGTALALAATVVAWCLRADYGIAPAILASIVTGALCGLLNGALVSYLRIVPFIVTLGTMTIFLGMAKLIASETTVRPRPNQVPAWLGDLVSTSNTALVAGAPLGVWLALALAALVALVLRYTIFGRHVFALGSNEATARLCGINVPVLKMVVYSLSGALIGIAGIYQFARLSVGNPTSGIGLELKVIAAVVIGGGSLNGGQGSVLGTLTGAGIMAVIASGCNAVGYSNPTQDIILGVIIVGAVSIDQLRQRRMAA